MLTSVLRNLSTSRAVLIPHVCRPLTPALRSITLIRPAYLSTDSQLNQDQQLPSQHEEVKDQKVSQPQLSDPVAIHARMMHHCHKSRPRAAFADYNALVSLGHAYLVSAKDILILINAIRMRQASRQDVLALIRLIDDLGAMSNTAASQSNDSSQTINHAVPLPVLEIALTRASQCVMLPEAQSLFNRIEQMTQGQPRLPSVAAILNVYRKKHQWDQCETLAIKYASPEHPWVLNRIRIEAFGKRALTLPKTDPQRDECLQKARALFKEYVANEKNPAALSKVHASMARIEFELGNPTAAQEVMKDIKEDHTGSAYNIMARMALEVDKDLDKALSLWRQELSVSRKASFAQTTETVLRGMLEHGRADIDILGVLSEYSQACLRNVRFARINYSPYAIVVQHWSSVPGDASRQSQIDSLWASIPGTPYLHDYAVGMMVNAYVTMGLSDRAKEFVRECVARGYQPRERTGWTEKRVEEMKAKVETQA